ncbi:DUF502 domain-containing protein [Bacteriovoracaceae bacterium]|nr:DUF502 domain-containing protein [Bacteriovoracaceae bacterium]
MKYLYQIFLKGFVVIMPVTLTVYFLFIISVKVESIFGEVIRKIITEEYYIPGYGIVLTVLLTLLTGVLVSNYMTNRFINFFTTKFAKVPLIKAIYNPLKDLMSLFGSNSGQQSMKRVVLYQKDHDDSLMIGLVTRDDLPEVSKFLDQDKGYITVYFPMSFMLGGFTILLPREKVIEIDLPVETAIKLAITGWFKAEQKPNYS